MKARIVSMVVLAASLLVASQVSAQSDGSATFGGQWWTLTKPEAKFQEYRVLPRGGYLQDYMLREFNGQWAGAIWGTDALQKDQGNSLFLAKGVKWRLDGQYNESPHLLNRFAISPYTRVAPGVFSIPDVVRQQNQVALASSPSATQGPKYNAAMQSLLAHAPGTVLGIQTDVSKLRLRARPMKDWQFEVKGSNRERQGSQAYGATFGMSNVVELPAPIDQHTIDVDATGTYTHGLARVLASVGVSKFENRVPTMIWDNPKTFRDSSYWRPPTAPAIYGSHTAVGSLGRMAMAPDNQVVRGNAVVSVKLPYSAIFTGSLAMSQTTQKQAFIPLTINSKEMADSARGLQANSLAALPAADLDGKATTIVQDYRLSGRPLQDLYGTLRFHEEKYDDKTASLTFNYGLAATDQSISRPTVTNPAPETEAWSHKTDIFGLDAAYAVNSKLDVSVLAERRMREHPLREVEKDAENVFGGSVRARPIDNVSVDASYKYGQRTLDSFDSTVYDRADRTLLRRFDVADRNQSAANGTVTWSASEKLDLSATGLWNKDEYPNSTIGLQSVDGWQVLGEGAVHPTSMIDAAGGFGYGETKSELAEVEGGSITNPSALNNPWTSNVKDKTVYAFAQATWWARPKKVQIGLQYTFMRDLQTNALADTIATKLGGPNFDLPSSFYRSHDVAVDARWHYSAGLELGLRYGYTWYTFKDLLAQTVPTLLLNPTNLNTQGSGVFLGTDRESYIAHRIQVFATRRF